MAISYTGVLRKDLAEKLGGLSPQGMTRLTGNEGSSIEPVSYTHLTLPTSDLV